MVEQHRYRPHDRCIFLTRKVQVEVELQSSAYPQLLVAWRLKSRLNLQAEKIH